MLLPSCAPVHAHSRWEQKMNDKQDRQTSASWGLLRRIAAGVLSLSVVAIGAHAQGNSQNTPAATHRKASPDLVDVANGRNAGNARWVQDGPRGRMVQVIITIDPKGDPQMNAARR